MRAPEADAILTTQVMGQADRFAIEAGRTGAQLMEAAGAGLAQAVCRRWSRRSTAVLCGPGNNGGDGWVAARHLSSMGWPVRVFSLVDRTELSGDAAWAASLWDGPVDPLQACALDEFGLVVDALFGAGLSRPLDGAAARLADEAGKSGQNVVAADVPSGLHGDRATADGAAFRADLTVTFHQFKPAHVLQPGADQCGALVVIDIGIPKGWRAAAPPSAILNHPGLWSVPGLNLPSATHKHRRGRLCVLSGPAGASGAARLAARAGLTGGAGFVTLLCPEDALAEAAAASDAIVTRAFDEDAPFAESLASHRASAAVMGPGGGVDARMKARVLSACAAGLPLVLDADALTAFEHEPEALFAALHPACVLTPHAGEFERLFPGLLEGAVNKIEATRAAAREAGAVVVFKGPDTVIAAPDGQAAVNTHASPRLATAGTGDVLAGLIGAFLAQGLSGIDAACAAVWIHGDAGRRLGPGATTLTVLDALPSALSGLRDWSERKAALRRVTARDR